jgi:hypothetical protein
MQMPGEIKFELLTEKQNSFGISEREKNIDGKFEY